MLGCSLVTTSYTVVCILFLRFVLPGKRPGCCIGSNVTSLCGVVRFATCLTRRVESSRFSVNFVTVGVWVDCVTVNISSINWVAFHLWFVRQSVHLSFIRVLKLLSSYSLSRCVTNCSYVPFSKLAWFIDFFRCGGILAYMNWSMIAWAATPNASSANFCSSSKKSIKFWFAGLKTTCWELCLAVALDWGFTYFLRNTVRMSARFSRCGLLTFLNVCSASPRMREWK